MEMEIYWIEYDQVIPTFMDERKKICSFAQEHLNLNSWIQNYTFDNSNILKLISYIHIDEQICIFSMDNISTL